MKTILRNFISVLRRFKMATIAEYTGVKYRLYRLYGDNDAGELRLHIRLLPAAG